MNSVTSSGVIRDAQPNDLKRIVEIYNLAIPGGRAVGHTEPVSVASKQQWFDSHDVARRPLWVLEREGVVIAWASLQSWSSTAAFDRTAEVSVYVAPEHQAQGLGRLMLRSLLAHCPSLGVDVVLGFTFGHNESTIRLNRSLGFELWGHLHGIAMLEEVARDILIFGFRVGGAK